MSPTETLEIERLLHLAQYRAAWQRLEAAMDAARALMHEVQPDEMAKLLVERDEQPETDDHSLLSLVAWLRQVAMTHAQEQRTPSLSRSTERERHPLHNSGVLRPFPGTRQRHHHGSGALLAGA
jgi:hypothetical protein